MVIKIIDLMILTHFDSDHSGGAVDIMKSVTVKKVVLNKDKDDSKTTKAIMSYLKQNNIQTKDAVNKDILYQEPDFSITAYTPDFTGLMRPPRPMTASISEIVTPASFIAAKMMFLRKSNWSRTLAKGASSSVE